VRNDAIAATVPTTGNESEDMPIPGARATKNGRKEGWLIVLPLTSTALSVGNVVLHRGGKLLALLEETLAIAVLRAFSFLLKLMSRFGLLV